MASSIRKFRLKLKCKDHAEYASKFAKRFDGDFFIPTDATVPIKDSVEVHLVFADGTVGIHGKARVVRASEERNTKGLVIRFTDQHTRKTGPFVAQASAEKISDFDEETPTRQSQLSEEMASALKEEPEEPEIIIENRPSALEPTATPEPAVAFEASAESDFGDLMSDLEDEAPSAEPVAVAATTPVAEAPEPTAAVNATPQTAANSESLASDVVEHAHATATTSTASSAKLWIAAGLLVAVGAGAFVVTRSADSAPPATQAVETPAAPSAADIAAKELSAKVDAAIATADKRAASGRLTGPDSALERLLAAKTLAPGHAKIQTRLASLADKFEQLATSALEAENLAEAATHLQAALLADPSRSELATQMQEIEEKVRNEQEP